MVDALLIENRVISYMSFCDNNDGFLTSHLRQLKCIIYDPNNLFQTFIGYSIYLMFLIIFFGNNKKKQTVHAYTRKCLISGNFYVCNYFFYSIHCFFYPDICLLFFSGKFRLLNLVSDFVLHALHVTTKKSSFSFYFTRISGRSAPLILAPVQLWHSVTQLSPWNGPFQQFPAKTEEDVWIQTSMLWLFVCSYLTIRRGNAECVASLEKTLSGNLPGVPLLGARANTTHTHQHNNTRRSHQEEEEKRRRRSICTTHLQHSTCPARPQSVMYPPGPCQHKPEPKVY